MATGICELQPYSGQNVVLLDFRKGRSGPTGSATSQLPHCGSIEPADRGVEGSGASARRNFLFGPYRLVPHRRDLFKYGRPVTIGCRALDVLIALVEAGGELVTKDELLTSVWLARVVEENCLQFQVSTLRKALGEHRDYIRTIFGRGYRFVADVAMVAPAPLPAWLGEPDAPCRDRSPGAWEK